MQIPLKAIHVFVVTARLGSLTKAALEFGVTRSAVSQQLQVLEAYLGTALLVKVGRGIRLTEAGERYFELVSDGVERIGEATDAMRGYNAVTVLSLRAAPTVATKLILPLLPSFLDAHPNLEVRLDGNNEPTGFGRETVDLEIRHGEGRWPGLFVEGLVEERIRPLCSPKVAPAGSLDPADVLDSRLIHSVKNLVQWGSWLRLAGVEPKSRWRRVLFDRAHMAIDAAADGIGIALESDLTTWREQQDGRLVCPVRNPPPVAVISLWIVCPPEHLRRKKVRLFVEWLKAIAQAPPGSASPEE